MIQAFDSLSAPETSLNYYFCFGMYVCEFIRAVRNFPPYDIRSFPNDLDENEKF